MFDFYPWNLSGKWLDCPIDSRSTGTSCAHPHHRHRLLAVEEGAGFGFTSAVINSPWWPAKCRCWNTSQLYFGIIISHEIRYYKPLNISYKFHVRVFIWPLNTHLHLIRRSHPRSNGWWCRSTVGRIPLHLRAPPGEEKPLKITIPNRK